MPSGIHHVTSIASSARRNLDFYAGTLGLRLVKKTVNFDDPASYHLYYGDAAGHPGTILTFFPWEGAPPGRLGVGEAQETVFSVPEGSIGYWTQRLIEKGVDPRSAGEALRRNDARLQGRRRDSARARGRQGRRGGASGWSGAEVPAEHAIRGFHSVSLLLAEAGPTAAILTDVFGFVACWRRGLDAAISGAGRRAGRRHRPEDRRRIPGGAPGRGLGPPHRLPGGRRCGASGDGQEARREPSSAHDRAEGPQLFPFGLFSRARPGAVRNRDRSARLRRRRADRVARPSAQVAAVPRGAPRRNRSRAAETRLAEGQPSWGPKLAIPVSSRKP